jgi:DNA replication protein DnaD
MSDGWITLHRKLKGSSFYKDSQAVHLWVHLLISANHKECEIIRGNKVYKIKRGELLTGRKLLSSETGINESKLQRLLKVFEKCHMIEQQTTNVNRLISVINYDQYQTSEQQTNSKRTASEQQVNTNNNVNNDNNVNNNKNKQKIILPDFVDPELWKDFMEIRRKNKAANTPRAIKTLINILEQNQSQANSMLTRSIVNSWKSLFPEKNKDTNKTPNHGIDLTKHFMDD